MSKKKENSITTVIKPDQIEKAETFFEKNGRFVSNRYKEGDQKITWINALNPASFNCTRSNTDEKINTMRPAI